MGTEKIEEELSSLKAQVADLSEALLKCATGASDSICELRRSVINSNDDMMYLAGFVWALLDKVSPELARDARNVNRIIGSAPQPDSKK